MDSLIELADEYFEYVDSHDQHSRLWNGKLANLELWNRTSADAIAEEQAALRTFADRAASITVDPSDQKRYALQQTIAQGARGGADFMAWNPQTTLLNPRMGLVELLLSFIDNFPLRTAHHGEAYLAMLGGAPDALDELAQAARVGADAGVISLASHLQETADGIDKYLATAPGPDERLSSQAPPTDLSPEDAAAWEGARDDLVAGTVRPALARFAEALHELSGRGRPDDKPGLCHLPGGGDVYAAKVRGVTLTDHTPDQIHALGLAKIAELEDEYRAIAGPLLGTDDITQIYSRLRDDQSLKYLTSEAIIADAETALARATAEAPKWFARVPNSPCRAVATPYGAMAYYSSPDPAVGKPGTFYFKTSEPTAWSTYELESIVYHESIPGHHLQLALHAEDEGLHKVQRELFNIAYAEGWGLYSERLADEMGLYTSDLARVGMLSADSLRAGRLVVDTGIHAMGWTREQAIQYLLDHSPMDRFHVEQEVDRYIGLPGQAVGYMIGRLEIQAIRAEAEKRPGFDIREFHDQVLRNGAVPLSTLRTLVLG